jgi:hypothetical protein
VRELVILLAASVTFSAGLWILHIAVRIIIGVIREILESSRWHMEEVATLGAGCFIVLCIVAVSALIGGLILWVLWNAAVPSIFHGPVITYWQAVLLAALLSVIGNFFKSSSNSK